MLALERIDAGPFGVARFECAKTGGVHSLRADQLFDAASVDVTPDTSRLSRREADLVAVRVDGSAKPIDPAKAKSFVHGLWPCDTRPRCVLLVEANPQLALGVVVLLEPRSPFLRRREELWRHQLQNLENHSYPLPEEHSYKLRA